MKVFICLYFIQFFNTKIFTQPTIKNYEVKTIMVVDNKYEKVKKIFNLKEVIAEINRVSKEGGMFANDGYKDYKKSKAMGYISAGLSLGAIVLLADNSTAKTSNIGIGLVVASFVPGSLSTYFRKLSTKKINRAIWLHNRDVLFPTSN
jgi:hypothetical protein